MGVILVNRHSLTLTLACSLAGLAGAAPSAELGEPSAKDRAARLFGPDKLWASHLEVSAENWGAMRPTRAGFFGAGQRPAARDKDRPAAPRRGGFGFDFDYVKGTFAFDGRKW